MRLWLFLVVLTVACGGGGGNTDTADAGSCDGCIDNSGTCVSGAAHDFCGHSGNSCSACSATEMCGEGVCETPPNCGPDSCSGCCDGDSCLGGDANAACGSGGLACEACPAELGATCVANDCEIQCGPDTCGGCCDGNICRDGDADGACGGYGDACNDCGADSCSMGECVSAACADSCAGCCSGSTCLGGDATTTCGSGGDACLDCGSNRLCESGGCVVDPTSRWDVIVVSGEVHENNTEDEPWDSFGGLPDPLVWLTAQDQPDLMQEHSSTYNDSLQPYWNDVVLADVPARLLQNYFYIQVYDDDVGNTDDYMGHCVPTITDASFSDTLLTLECPRNTSEGVAGFTVRYRIRPH